MNRLKSVLRLIALSCLVVACGGSDDNVVDIDADVDANGGDITHDVPDDGPPDVTPDTPDADVDDTDVPDPGTDVDADVDIDAEVDTSETSPETTDPPTPPSTIRIVEVMTTPCAATAGAGQWLELWNFGSEPVDIEGWTIVVEGSSSHQIDHGAPLVVPAGDVLVLGASGDALTNGGYVPDYVYAGITLPSGEGEITIRDLEDDVHAIDLSRLPDPTCASISFGPSDPLRSDTEREDDWCSGVESYGDGDQGTPGLRNPRCETEIAFVDWCRLQFPQEISGYLGESQTVYGRVFKEGITDRTSANDPAPGFRGQVGVGPQSSDPAGNAAWSWIDATPNPGWNDAAEPGNDEYQASLVIPQIGTYDYAFRFSADNGGHWLYCDLQRPGSDGSDDGYQIENAGRLTSLDPCAGAPCSTPPAPTCVDGTVVRTFTGAGTCAPDGALPVCTFASSDENCAASGGICLDGSCVEPADGPETAGALIITEVMARSRAGLDPGEWFELFNTTEDTVDLFGCSIGDGTNPAQHTISRPLAVAAGSYVVLGASADRSVNGNTPVDYAWTGFALRNDGDTISLTCGDLRVDTFTYPGSSVALGQSLQLDIDFYDGESNDDLDNWCLGSIAYAPGLLGTPGEANESCAEPEWTIGFCRLQFPDLIDEIEGTSVEVFGRVYAEGLTDQGPANNPSINLVGQLGYGPDGSVPDETWTWVDASPNEAYNGALVGEPNNDEYRANLVVPNADGSPYAMAYRFSGDAGDTWTNCDADEAGSSNGYDPNEAGVIISRIDDPCLDDPCLQQAAFCEDDDTLTTWTTPECIIDRLDLEGPGYICSSDQVVQDCSATGGTCVSDDGLARCEGPPTYEVDYCRLQFPLSFTITEGDTATIYGRLYIEGLTDQSPGADPDDAVMGQAGYGPSGTDPSDEVDAALWTWFDADNNLEYTSPAGTDEDEYQADIVAPAANEVAYALAYRFSGDFGATWSYCDTSGGGTTIPYDPELEGEMFVVEPVCGPDTCDETPPEPDCADEFTVRTYEGAAVCVDEDGVPNCVFDATTTLCDTELEVCEDGTCVPIEPVDLCDPNPCEFIPDPTCNPFEPTEQIVYTGPGVCSVDEPGVASCAYDEIIQPCDEGLVCNDATGMCVEPTLPLTIDFCRLHFPDTIVTFPFVDHVVYGRVYIEGLTDQTQFTDTDPRLFAQVGFGETLSDPSQPGVADAWVWFDAFPNLDYDDQGAFGEPNNDEYEALIFAPEAQLDPYAMAYRFTGDGGLTWTYCDAAGNTPTSPYDPSSAGSIVVEDAD